MRTLGARGASTSYMWQIGRIDLYVKVQCTPRVTLGEILRDLRQELFLGRFYVTTAKSYSWAVF